MRSVSKVVVALVVVIAAIVILQERADTAVAQNPRAGAPPQAQQQGAGPGESLPVRLQVSVYELVVKRPTEFTSDVSKLERSARSPGELEKALGEFGEARLVADIYRAADLERELNVSLGSNIPMSRGILRNQDGQPQQQINYQNVGVLLEINAARGMREGTRFVADVSFEASSVIDSTINYSEGTSAPIFAKWRDNSRMRFEFDKPSVAVLLNTPDKGEPTTAMVVRYLVTPQE